MSAVTTERDRLAEAVTETAAAVVEARAVLAQWEELHESSKDEMASLEQRGGDEVLDEQATVQTIARRIREVREGIVLNAKAVEAQRERVRSAELAYLAAEADAYEPNVADAQARLDAHRSKVDRLVAQLARLEGDFVPDAQPRTYCERPNCSNNGIEHSHGHRSYPLKQAVIREERRLQVGRTMAADGDPEVLVRGWLAEDPFDRASRTDFYPPYVWRPDALVPAPFYRDPRDMAEKHLTALEQQAEDIPEQIRAIAKGLPQRLPQAPPPGVERDELLTVGTDPTAEARIVRLEERQAHLSAEIEEARRRVEELRAADG